MKKFRYVNAAEGDNEDIFKDTIDALKDDFDYVLSGLDKLQRSSREEEMQALDVANELSSAIQTAIASIADTIQE